MYKLRDLHAQVLADGKLNGVGDGRTEGGKFLSEQRKGKSIDEQLDAGERYRTCLARGKVAE